MALVNDGAEMALTQWGIWCRSNTGAPHDAISWMGPFLDRMRGQIIDPDDRPVRLWEDPVCEAFDAHVMQYIRTSHPDEFRALAAYYAFPAGDDDTVTSKAGLARRLRTSRNTAIKRLESGIKMVAMAMHMAA